MNKILIPLIIIFLAMAFWFCNAYSQVSVDSLNESDAKEGDTITIEAKTVKGALPDYDKLNDITIDSDHAREGALFVRVITDEPQMESYDTGEKDEHGESVIGHRETGRMMEKNYWCKRAQYDHDNAILTPYEGGKTLTIARNKIIIYSAKRREGQYK